jgi:ABC-type sugar transport system substrate-binding protein
MNARIATSALMLAALVMVTTGSAQTKKYKIGALFKNESNPYFLTMKKGYQDAAKEMNVEIVTGSTPTENAADQQLALLETWLNQGGFDGLIVTPFRATSLNSGLAKATAKKIPIINIDEIIPEDAATKDGVDIAVRVASNNVTAGKLAALKALKLVPKASEAAIIEGAAGTTSSADRVAGFRKNVEAGGLKVVSSQPADWDRNKAFNVASNVLQANPNVKVIFCANDDMGLGAVRAVQAAGKKGQIQIFSVDGTPEAIAAVKAGDLAGTVAQNPDEMAQIAVEAMLKILKGRPVPDSLESPVGLITKENAK